MPNDLEVKVGARTFTVKAEDWWSQSYMELFRAEIRTWTDEQVLAEGKNRVEWVLAPRGTSTWKPPMGAPWSVPHLRPGRGVCLAPGTPIVVTSDDLEYQPVFPRTVVELHLLREEYRRRHHAVATAAPDPNIVTGSVELIVTPELREKIALKRRKQRALGEELHATGRGEIDLGDINGDAEETE